MMKDKFKLFLFSSWIINITKTHITHSFAAQFSHKAQSKKTCRHSFSVGGAPEPELPPKVLAMLLVREMVLFLSLVGDIPLTCGHTPPCTSSDLDRWVVKEEPSSVKWMVWFFTFNINFYFILLETKLCVSICFDISFPLTCVQIVSMIL